MKTIEVPEYVLLSIENTLRRWANINDSYKKESCLDRDSHCLTLMYFTFPVLVDSISM